MTDPEDVKKTIRALVGVIQSASQGGSPVDHQQLDHIRKVVRLLSLSHEQVRRLLASAPCAPRARAL